VFSEEMPGSKPAVGSQVSAALAHKERPHWNKADKGNNGKQRHCAVPRPGQPVQVPSRLSVRLSA
jgi:hypothetical protein